jgi:hypothetical protein
VQKKRSARVIQTNWQQSELSLNFIYYFKGKEKKKTLVNNGFVYYNYNSLFKNNYKED